MVYNILVWYFLRQKTRFFPFAQFEEWSISAMTPLSMDKPLDRRQKKTRMAIQNALLVLMRDKPIDKITVSELAIAADVNRKTFYNHYRSIADVRSELEQQHIDHFLSFIREAPTAQLRAEPNYFIEHLVTVMASNMERTRLIFDSGEQYYLAEQFKLCALPTLEEITLTRAKHPEYLPYVVDYMVNGLVHLLENWVNSTNPAAPHEFAEITVNLIRSSCGILELYYTASNHDE